MDRTVIVALLNNIAFLLVLSVIYEISHIKLLKHSRIQSVFSGLLIAIIGIVIMRIPFTMQPGLFFDTRTILVSSTALIFGPYPTAFVVVATSVYRMFIGGSGTLAGLSTIMSSAFIGLIWRQWIYPKSTRFRWLSVYAMGVTVHVGMLICMLLLPYPDSINVIRVIAAPVILLYPVVSVMLCMLLLRQQELRHIQDQLILSEEKFKLLFEKAPLGYQSLDSDGCLKEVNQQWLDIFGYTRDEVIGKWFGDFFSQASKEKFIQSFSAFKSHGHTHVEHELLHKNGEPIYVAIEGKLVYDSEGKFAQTHCILQDITSERKAHINYQLLFDKMVDGFSLHEIICDDHGNPVDYRFLVVNPAFEHLTGLKSTDIIGKTVMEVLPDTESYWIETYGKVALTGVPLVFRNYSTALDKYFEVSAYQPAPNQFAATFSDITDLIQAEENAKKNLTRLKSLLDNSPSPIVIIDSNGKFVEVSNVAEKILGLPKEEIFTKDITEIAPLDMAKKALFVLSQSSTDGQILEKIDIFEVEGNRRYFESRIFPISMPSNNEKLFGYLGIDVTERIMAEHALKESEEKYSSYIENAPDGVCLVDENGQFIEVNRCASEMTGYDKEQLLQMSFKDITADESLESAILHFDNLKKIGSMKAEFKFIHADGSIRWWNIDAVKLSEKKYLGFTSDITEKKEIEANLLYMINHDSLTGLYNRKYFDEKLRQVDSLHHLPLSIIIADINGLKLINDSYGHQEGDQVIIQAAELINKCCQEKMDSILARTGGDEFCILLPKTDLDSALQLMKSIQDMCYQYNSNVSNQTLHLSISLGADTKESINDDIKQVLKKAEDFMNQRKLLEKSSSYSAIISSIKATMLEKSFETEAHSDRMAQLSKKIGLILNLSQTELDHIELLATLHDIGKVGIAERILKKPGRLDAEEWAEMKKHPEIGYRIAMSSPNLAPIANYILHHHERWDGNGYPRNLKGTNIPLISRIIAIVDAYDAMTEDRVYQKAKTHKEAIEEIKRCAGTQFDPNIAQIFIEAMSDRNLQKETIN